MNNFCRAVLFGSAILASAGLVALPAGAANTSKAALQGAWVQEGLVCKDFFVKKGSSLEFRRPIDVFAPTFIVSGQRLKTPQAACRIVKVTSSGARHALSLSCTTSISVADVTAQLSMGEDGRLSRYFNAQDQSGSKYEKCNL